MGPWVHMNVQVMNVQVTKMGNKNDASCTHVIIQTCKHLLPTSMTMENRRGYLEPKTNQWKKVWWFLQKWERHQWRSCCIYWLHCGTCVTWNCRSVGCARSMMQQICAKKVHWRCNESVCESLLFLLGICWTVVRTRISIIRRLILVIILRSTCTSMILAYSRDLNPTEPMNSWMRKQKGVGELSDCMGTSVGTGMFMWIK